MRILSNIMLLWAVFLSFLAMVNASFVGIRELGFGIVLTWIYYLIFMAGSSLVPIKNHRESENYFPHEIKIFFYCVIFSVIAILSSIQFYTGKSFGDLLNGLASGAILYNEYQEYFEEAGLAVFSIKKIPFILLMAASKWMLIFWLIRSIAYQSTMSMMEYVFCVALILAYLLLSLARGTSFEVFELVNLIIFSYLLKLKRYRARMNVIFILIVFALLISSAVAMFLNNVSTRGFGGMHCVTIEMCLDPSTYIMVNVPELGLLTYSISGYFVFGIFFTSTVLERILLDSPLAFIQSLIPGGLLLKTQSNEGFHVMVCDKFIDCGVAWVPSVMHFTFYFGLLGVAFMVLLLGRISAQLENSAVQKSSIVDGIGMYLLWIFMISFPVGNFLFVSSSSQLCLVMFLLLKYSKFARHVVRRVILPHFSSSKYSDLPPKNRLPTVT